MRLLAVYALSSKTMRPREEHIRRYFPAFVGTHKTLLLPELALTCAYPRLDVKTCPRYRQHLSTRSKQHGARRECLLANLPSRRGERGRRHYLQPLRGWIVFKRRFGLPNGAGRQQGRHEQQRPSRRRNAMFEQHILPRPDRCLRRVYIRNQRARRGGVHAMHPRRVL